MPRSRAFEVALLAVLDVIVPRRPGDEGLYAEGGVPLGIRRLSGIDLAYGWQPVAARTPSRRGLLFRGRRK